MHELPKIPYFCWRCCIPLASTNLCGNCLQNPPPFEKMLTPYLYDMPIMKIILDLKFKKQLANARVLGELVAQYLQSFYETKPLPDTIIPMPLHTKRLRERGFNQALEIARPISRFFNIPINTQLMARVKHTNAQATLDKKARQQNIKNAFYLKKSMENAFIAVIDDVYTTGSTMQEFCSTLKKGGVKEIHVWCVARAANYFS